MTALLAGGPAYSMISLRGQCSNEADISTKYQLEPPQDDGVDSSSRVRVSFTLVQAAERVSQGMRMLQEPETDLQARCLHVADIFCRTPSDTSASDGSRSV